MNARILTIIMIILASAILLSGCGAPAPLPATPTLSQDAVATQVAAVLTSTSIVLPPSPIAVTATAQLDVVQPTEEVLPTNTAVPTEAPTATQTTAPSPTAAPTSTPVQNDPRSVLGGAAFTDKTFKENSNWGKAWENDYTKGEFIDNQLALTSIGVDGWTLSWPKVDDMYIEMTATTETCSGADRYGMIVRVPESFDTGYLVGFTCDGRYSLRLWNPEEEQYQYLIQWTNSDKINAGANQTNRIGLWVEGDTFKVYANGHLLGQAQDDELEGEGRIGPWIGHDKTDNFTVNISEISYWDLP